MEVITTPESKMLAPIVWAFDNSCWFNSYLLSDLQQDPDEL